MEKAIEIEYVERSRSRRLVDLMASNDLYTGEEIPQEVQEYWQQFEAIQQQIDQERFGNKDSGNKHKLMEVGASSRDRSSGKTSTRVSVASPFAELGAKAAKENRAALEAFNEILTALEAEKHQVWQKLRQLDPVLACQIQISPLNEAAMQQLVDQPNTAILSFYTTSNDTYIFVLRQNQISCYICPGQGQKTLQDGIEQN